MSSLMLSTLSVRLSVGFNVAGTLFLKHDRALTFKCHLPEMSLSKCHKTYKKQCNIISEKSPRARFSSPV